MAKDKKYGETDQADVASSVGGNYQASTDLYRVTFRGNRVFEAVVNRVFFRWEGQELVTPEKYKDGIPAAFVNHPEMQQHSNVLNFIPIK